MYIDIYVMFTYVRVNIHINIIRILVEVLIIEAKRFGMYNVNNNG